MTTRTKTLGVAAAIAAIAVSIPTAVTAYADDPVPPPAPAPSSTVSTPAAPIPDPQGPGCDDFKKALTAGGGSLAGLMALNASTAIASIPQASTFSSAISGGLNPAVNVVSVLDNGPYNVFIPTNDAFEKLDPAELETLKTDPAALTGVLYYHMALGVLGPDDIHGKLTTQQGKQITVTGKGGDIKFDDTAKVVCGGITGANSKIYLIDTVLSPSNALAGTATTTTSPTSATETTSTTAPSEASATPAAPNAEVAPSPSAAAPAPAAPAPAA
jgi:uncharacterized surface protein with fasciclin (FAS1) repeats